MITEMFFLSWLEQFLTWRIVEGYSIQSHHIAKEDHFEFKNRG